MLKHVMVFIGIGFFAGCASLKVYEMPKVQAELSKAFSDSEDVAQKMKTDFVEKQGVITHLKKTKSTQLQGVLGQIETHMKAMETSLEDIAQQKRKMSEANAQVVALAYNRDKVHSHESEYARIEEAVRQFELAAKTLNASAQDYSVESNALAKLVADRKLFFNFDVAEFQQKIDGQIRSAQSFQGQMKTEIERGNALVLNWPKVTGRQEAESILKQMVNSAQEFTQKAQKLSLISRDLDRVTMGYAKVSTTEKVWPEVQKLLNENDRATKELAERQAEFTKLNQALRKSAQGAER